MTGFILSEIIGRELHGLLNPWAFMLAFLGVGLMGVVLVVVAVLDSRPASGLPRYVWPYRVAGYFFGCLGAMLAVFGGQYFAPVSLETSYMVAVLAFALPHRVFFGHGALIFALAFAGLFFYGYFFAGFTSLLLLATVYTVGRVWLYKLDKVG